MPMRLRNISKQTFLISIAVLVAVGTGVWYIQASRFWESSEVARLHNPYCDKKGVKCVIFTGTITEGCSLSVGGPTLLKVDEKIVSLGGGSSLRAMDEPRGHTDIDCNKSLIGQKVKVFADKDPESEFYTLAGSNDFYLTKL